MERIDRQTYYASKGIVQLIADELDAPPQCGIEIGVHRGITSMMLLRFFPNLHLYMVDPWQVYDEVDRNQDGHDDSMRQAVLRTDCFSGRRQIVRSTSHDAKNIFPSYFADFLFIDGDHSGDAVLRDLKEYTPKVRKGGLVICHDIKQPQVFDAVKAFCEPHGIRFAYNRARSGFFTMPHGKHVAKEWHLFDKNLYKYWPRKHGGNKQSE